MLSQSPSPVRVAGPGSKLGGRLRGESAGHEAVQEDGTAIELRESDRINLEKMDCSIAFRNFAALHFRLKARSAKASPAQIIFEVHSAT